jgi:hypothetical protein
VEFAALEDKKLRSQLKDPNFIEAQTTALQIASLRRINTGSKVILLDRYGGQAESVAKELAKKGYSKVGGGPGSGVERTICEGWNCFPSGARCQVRWLRHRGGRLVRTGCWRCGRLLPDLGVLRATMRSLRLRGRLPRQLRRHLC